MRNAISAHIKIQRVEGKAAMFAFFRSGVRNTRISETKAGKNTKLAACPCPCIHMVHIKNG